MNPSITRSCAAFFVLISTTTMRAGDLDPPVGPVMPTMKNLQQVEPRTPIETLPGDDDASHVISQPGSYYLTGNLVGANGKHGIQVLASDVTIDLNGFTLQGVPGSLDGINGPGFEGPFLRNLVVRNGTIFSWSGNGISAPAINQVNIEAVVARGNTGNGLRTGGAGVIVRCIARENGSRGILLSNSGGIATECTALGNGSDGFLVGDGGSVINCQSSYNVGSGIATFNSHHLIRGCLIERNSQNGITTISHTTIEDCSITFNSMAGVSCGGLTRIVDNHVNGNGNGGIICQPVAPSGDNHIEGNTITGNNRIAIDLTGNASNNVFRNILRRNGNNSIVNAAASQAPVSNNAATAGPWANIVTP